MNTAYDEFFQNFKLIGLYVCIFQLVYKIYRPSCAYLINILNAITSGKFRINRFLCDEIILSIITKTYRYIINEIRSVDLCSNDRCHSLILNKKNVRIIGDMQ